MEIKNMTAEQLQNLIRNTVDEILDEYFCDIDQMITPLNPPL